MDMSALWQRFPSLKQAAVAVAAVSVLATAAQAGPTTLPWSDGDGDIEIVTDENGNKIKLTKAEKAAKAAELAPTLTAMLADPDFPDYHLAKTRVDASYVVYLGGFHLSTMAFSIAVNGNAYEIKSNIHTDGLVDKFVRTNADIGARGTFLNHKVTPALYNSDITDKNQRQLVSISYGEAMPDTILSFPKYNLKKYPVSDLEKWKSVDPVSAIMQMGLGIRPQSNAGTSNPCGGKIPIFDGRRRFDLTLEYLEEEEITSGKEKAFEGIAIKCWVGFKKVAGYKPPKKKKRARQNGRSEWPDVYMWMAPVGGEANLYVPVRFEARTSLGAVISRATKLEVSVTEEKPETHQAATEASQSEPVPTP